MAINARRQRFVDEYIVDLNATQAAIRAGYSEKTAASQGERLLRDAGVKAALAIAIATRAERTQVTADQVVKRLWAIATADPNDLIEFRRTCCRYCHSINHEYQRTQVELDRDRAGWEALQKKSSKEEFDVAGGVGYNAKRDPNPECPECFGEGIGQSFVKDTRKLSAEARALYAGVKVTKDGIDVRMHDPIASAIAVGRHLGMFIDKVDHTTGGKPIEALIMEAANGDGSSTE